MKARGMSSPEEILKPFWNAGTLRCRVTVKGGKDYEIINGEFVELKEAAEQ